VTLLPLHTVALLAETESDGAGKTVTVWYAVTFEQPPDGDATNEYCVVMVGEIAKLAVEGPLVHEYDDAPDATSVVVWPLQMDEFPLIPSE
jgi:hypothetical protein